MGLWEMENRGPMSGRKGRERLEGEMPRCVGVGISSFCSAEQGVPPLRLLPVASLKSLLSWQERTVFLESSYLVNSLTRRLPCFFSASQENWLAPYGKPREIPSIINTVFRSFCF